MTTAADDFAAEQAFEAFLAGRPVPEETADTFAGVAAFAGAVRATAIEPGRPNAALAELLATGLLTDQLSPSTVTARSAGRSPRRTSRVRRRRRSAMFFFPALVAKILSAGAIAQAATGAGIVVVAFTGAGAAGVLPGPVQNTVATVVGTVTPFDLPHSTDSGTPVATTSVPVPAAETTESTETSSATSEAPETTETTAPASPTSTASNAFGKRVSEDAKDGGVNGQEISKEAHERNEARKSARATGAPVRTEHESGETEKSEDGDHHSSKSGESSGHGGSGDD